LSRKIPTNQIIILTLMRVTRDSSTTSTIGSLARAEASSTGRKDTESSTSARLKTISVNRFRKA